MGISITINMDNIITTRGKEMKVFLEHFFFAITMAIALAIPVVAIVLMLQPYFT